MRGRVPAIYRAVYITAEQVRTLAALKKLAIPVLAFAGEKGIGANHEALVRAFASNVRGNVVVLGAGHFLAEERPNEITAALKTFLADQTPPVAACRSVTGCSSAKRARSLARGHRH